MGGPVVMTPPANAKDPGSIPGPGRSHRRWGGEARVKQLLKLSCPIEPMLHNKRNHYNEKLACSKDHQHGEE